MTSTLKHGVNQGIIAVERAEKEVSGIGAGGEVVEVEKGVRVRKSGGVELATQLTEAEIEVRKAELQAQIEYQKTLISRAREEVLLAAKQANEQEILARESLELKEFNRKTSIEAGNEARKLLREVSALVEQEKEYEARRAETHRAALETERARVQAKSAEVMAREEALEAEKREQYHCEMIRQCKSRSLKFKLEEEQAKLKLESLQFSLHHNEYFPLSTASKKATIVVEVEPREIPEARQFDTSPMDVSLATAELGEEGESTFTETRSVEEIVASERSSGIKHHSASYLHSVYSEGTTESQLFEHGRPLGGIAGSGPEMTQTTVIQELPAPSTAAASIAEPASVPSSVSQQAQTVSQQAQNISQPAQNIAQQAVPQSQLPAAGGAAAAPAGAAPAAAEAAPAEADKAAKKQKGGFFKKFGLGKHQEGH